MLLFKYNCRITNTNITFMCNDDEKIVYFYNNHKKRLINGKKYFNIVKTLKNSKEELFVECIIVSRYNNYEEVNMSIDYNKLLIFNNVFNLNNKKIIDIISKLV